jgi:hypothetical protein
LNPFICLLLLLFSCLFFPLLSPNSFLPFQLLSAVLSLHFSFPLLVSLVHLSQFNLAFFPVFVQLPKPNSQHLTPSQQFCVNKSKVHSEIHSLPLFLPGHFMLCSGSTPGGVPSKSGGFKSLKIHSCLTRTQITAMMVRNCQSVIHS